MNSSFTRPLAYVAPFLILIAGCGDDTGVGGRGGSGGGGANSGGVPNQGGGGSSADGGGGMVSNGGGGAVSDGGGGAVSDGGGGGVSDGGGGSGQGGGEAAAPECEEDTDCFLSNDCCECAGRPVGEPVPVCNMLCIQDKCQELQVPGVLARCVAGRCVSPASCDAGAVICATPPPVCLAGSLPIVQGNCYPGGCMPALECTEVTDCTSCPSGPKLTCVSNIAQLPSYHCVDVKDPCIDADCSCLGPSVCLSPFDSCAESATGIDCSCPACLF